MDIKKIWAAHRGKIIAAILTALMGWGYLTREDIGNWLVESHPTTAPASK